MYRIEYRRGYDNKETMIFFIDCVLINLLIIFIWKKLFSTLLNTLLLLSEDGFHIVKNIWTSELRAAGSQNCNLIIAETDRQYTKDSLTYDLLLMGTSEQGGVLRLNVELINTLTGFFNRWTTL